MANRDRTVEHYARALSFRPDHPDNIVIEYRIGVLLTQRHDPGKPMVWRRAEGLEYFDRVLNNHQHEDFYTVEPAPRVRSPQVLTPSAGIKAGSILLNHHRDPEAAQDRYYQAMEALNSTYQRRRADWLARAPEEPDVNSPDWNPREQRVWESVEAKWDKRRADAERGDVFEEDSYEMSLTKVVVDAYAHSYEHSAGSGMAGLGRILEDFPDTPMARLAGKKLSELQNMFDQQLAKSVASSVDAIVLDAGDAGVLHAGQEVSLVVTRPPQESEKGTEDSEPPIANASDADSHISWLPILAGSIVFLLALTIWRSKKK
jgi:hypothetical protein